MRHDYNIAYDKKAAKYASRKRVMPSRFNNKLVEVLGGGAGSDWWLKGQSGILLSCHISL